MADALIALGGNIGDVRANFRSAISEILTRTGARLIARSADYRTPPWGDENQPSFVNACIRIETDFAPVALLDVLQAVEAALGRNRDTDRRWGPRTLDLDLLAYDDMTLRDPRLELPHPRLFERAFVLVPLCDIAADRPIAGRTPAEALKALSRKGIDKLPEL